MNTSANSQPSSPVYQLEGSVDLGSFIAQRRLGEAAIVAAAADDAAIAINFAQLTTASSLTVALMIAWYRCAQAHGCAIRFVQLPAALQQIVDFSGLGEVLPIEAGAVDVAG